MLSGQAREEALPAFLNLPLPPEITFLILLKFTAKDLTILARVSQATNVYTQDNRLWLRIFGQTS